MNIIKFKSWLLPVASAAIFLACTATSQAQITVIASFNGTNGTSPMGNLTLIGSTLYGTADNGGTGNNGTVFSVPVGGGTPTIVAGFNINGGGAPHGSLTLIGSTLYGTNWYGEEAPYQNGTVFSVPVAGGTPTVLSTFMNPPYQIGASPGGNLTLIGSTFYGTTVSGGIASAEVVGGYGTVFSVPVTGGTPTAIASFNGTNGHGPMGSLAVSADGSTLYGTTVSGGIVAAGAPGGYGTVFSVPVSGGTITTLASFNGTNGYSPNGSLTLIGSTLYGTTTDGAGGYGTVFSVPVSGGTPTVIAIFKGGINGSAPFGSLTLSGDGSTFYGTTTYGGTSGYGTVFSVPVSGGTPITLANFNGTNGSYPHADLILVGTTLYGTTQQGGTNGDGTVFSVSAVPSVQSWRQTWYSTVNNSTNAADTASPYGNGIPNLAVFAFLGVNQNPATAKLSQLPQPRMSSGNFVYSFTQPVVSGVTYGAQYTTSLNPTNWQTIPDTGSGTQHTFSVETNSSSELFVRLTVTEQ